MRVMVLLKATEDSEKGHFPEPWTTEMMAVMGKFNDELQLRNAGILRDADGLKRSSHGNEMADFAARRNSEENQLTNQ